MLPALSKGQAGVMCSADCELISRLLTCPWDPKRNPRGPVRGRQIDRFGRQEVLLTMGVIWFRLWLTTLQPPPVYSSTGTTDFGSKKTMASTLMFLPVSSISSRFIL